MEPNYKAIPANLVKRTVAGILDFFLNFMVTMSLFAFVALPISNQFFSGNELGAQIQNVQISSHLFVINEDTGRVTTLAEDDQKEAIYRYYMETDYSPTFHSDHIEDYYTQILGKDESGNPLDFTKPINSFTPWEIATKTTYSEAEITSFYRDIYQRAIADFQLSTAYQPIADELNLLTTIDLIICLGMGSVIIYVLVPLFTRNGKTFGKIVMRIGVTNYLGYQSEKRQLVFRNITSVLFHYVGALLLVPFFSYLWMIFSKKHQNLVDLFAGTLVIDEVMSVIYVDANAQLAYEEELQKRIVALEEKRKKVILENEAKRIRPGVNANEDETKD